MTPASLPPLLLLLTACGASRSTATTAARGMYEDCRAYDNTTWFGGEVCGSDGITYPSAAYLHCLSYQQPQRRVSVRHAGPCSWTPPRCPYSALYTPVCGSDGRTYANLEALDCRRLLDPAGGAVRLRHAGECYRERPCRRAGGQRTPVCASNGFTYPGVDDVDCLRSMGAGVRVVHEGGCSLPEVRSLVGSQYHACLALHTHAEWNPVCGPDGTTYPSPLLVFCRWPDSWGWQLGECGSETQVSCAAAAWYRDCGVPGATSQVCGSDGHTYSSAEELRCAARYSRYLTARHAGHCQPQDDPCVRTGDLAGRGQPVCGSDGLSYVSPDALWCSRAHKPYLRYVHDGVCLLEPGLLH